jgi:hypothetical protein
MGCEEESHETARGLAAVARLARRLLAGHGLADGGAAAGRTDVAACQSHVTTCQPDVTAAQPDVTAAQPDPGPAHVYASPGAGRLVAGCRLLRAVCAQFL